MFEPYKVLVGDVVLNTDSYNEKSHTAQLWLPNNEVLSAYLPSASNSIPMGFDDPRL
ncbi:hypothetical protein IG631_18739 [Alternaria alternata]|nr:hypothetical protein IG631_18739 [Alternaria alternata]